MPVTWSEHVGEVEMRLTADDEAGILSAAVQALAELLTDDEAKDATATDQRRVTADGADRPALLASWLEELNYLAEAEGLIANDVADIRLDDHSATADVTFHRGEPPHLIKAVTYHRLAFEPDENGWMARAVLDV